MQPIAATDFTADFRGAIADAWLPADKVTAAEWAERYRILGPRVASEPGPYSMDRTPYLRGIHEALSDSRYSEVVLVKPAQCGGSETGRNWLGWCADLEPGPHMLVFPTEQACKETITERVMPMLQDSPRLARLITSRAHDFSRQQIRLSSMDIYIGWAGSCQALASRPIQRVTLDEVDKFPVYRGKEADPISLARVRTQTYGARAKVFLLSTPTIPTGPITRSYEACPDKRSYCCPCRECGELSELLWDNVSWDGQSADSEDELLDQQRGLEGGQVEVRYTCPACKAQHTDHHRWDMVRAGQWVSDGYPPGTHPGSRAVGFRIPGLASPWVSFTSLAREYVAARLKGLGEIQHFYNSLLGVPFWGSLSKSDVMQEVRPDKIWGLANEARLERGVVPDDKPALIAAADPGKIDIHWVVRAWGPGFDSVLVDCGVARSLAELKASTVDREYLTESGQAARCHWLYIDSGGGSAAKGTSSRTDEIYRFASEDSARIHLLKGRVQAVQPLAPVTTRSHTYRPPGQQASPYDVTLSIIDTTYFKDLLSDRINQGDSLTWGTFRNPGRDYVMQLCSERKILIERRVSAAGEVREVLRWVPRAAGTANHYWDCEVYCGAGAYALDIGARAQATRPRQAEIAQAQSRRVASRDGRAFLASRRR